MKKLLLMIVCFILCSCSVESPESDSFNATKIQEQNELAKHSPYEPYGELITYNLAKLTGLNNMPSGDTYENNAITRYLKDKLNIQNHNVIEADSSQYNNSIDIFISSKNLPDIMIVSDIDDLQYLVENDMIEDLTTAYNECTTDRIKDIFNSYGNSLLDLVTFDNKIMALPETNISNGPNLIWLRKDWMDKLNLQEPKTLDDVIEIVRQFKATNTNNIGIMFSTDIAGESAYSSEYLLDVIFNSYNAFPKHWYKENEEIIYGSTTKEAKAALSYIHNLFKEGILDNDFALRTTNNIVEEIVNGNCGSFFGPWWSSNNPLVDAVSNDPSMEWKCYLIPTNSDGTITYVDQTPTSKYVVVRKGYEHPEIIFKMISVQFDYLRFIDTNAVEINNYERNNVDQTARPLSINIDYKDALIKSHQNIDDVINNKKNINDIPILDAAYATACLDYLHNDSYTSQDWAAYASRIEAPSLFDFNKISEKNVFYGTTPTMKNIGWKLKEIEKKYYLEFIMGKRDLNDFDIFVSEWNKEGGEQIKKEIEAYKF